MTHTHLFRFCRSANPQVCWYTVPCKIIDQLKNDRDCTGYILNQIKHVVLKVLIYLCFITLQYTQAFHFQIII